MKFDHKRRLEHKATVVLVGQIEMLLGLSRAERRERGVRLSTAELQELLERERAKL